MKKKGEITVFLTLMLSVLSAFIVTLAKTVRVYMSRTEAAFAADNAVKSCFAQYNRELFNRFHILVIDSSYKTEERGAERVSGHFSTFLENSMSGNELICADISCCRSASGDNGKYLYESSVRYAKETLCIDSRVTGTDDDAYYITYLLHVCGNDDIPREGSARRGEIEYLVYGCEEDDENIRWARLDHADTDEGDYEEYLIRRLEEEGTAILRRRFADLVTEYMRENGSPGFDLDDCYYDVTFSATVKDRLMNEYTVTRKYGYEPDSI